MQTSPAGDYAVWQPPAGHDNAAYRRVLARLYALGQGRMLPGRDRLRDLLRRAGNPHLAVPSVLVGGTNGKGRCVAGLSAILSRRLRCGAFIKPHLVSIRERWRIDDATVDIERFTASATEALDLIESQRRQGGDEISFFEANVLIGSLLFRAAGCDMNVWEIGLGGREDACNLMDPRLSILCNVGYDHQAILGNTLAEIATDKAHIARSGRTLLLGGPRPGWEDAYAEYRPAVQAVCQQLGAQMEEVPAGSAAAWTDYIAAGAQGLPPDTCALLMAALRHLQPGADSPGALATLELRYPGRMQRRVIGGLDLSAIPGAEHIGAVPPVMVLLDAAHNSDSLAWLARVLASNAGRMKPPLLFGCQASRDPQEMLAPLAAHVSVLVPLEVPVLRPCPLAAIITAAERLGLPVSLPPGLSASQMVRDYPIGHLTELDPPDNRTRWLDCVAHAMSLSTPEAPLLICGSIYNLGEVLRVFAPDS